MSEPFIRDIQPSDIGPLTAFFARVPEGDRTFFREDVLDAGVLQAWLADGASRRFAALHGNDVAGYGAVIPEVGWSAHVGELRVVVDPNHRRHGVGGALARHGLLTALEHGLSKLIVEVAADQDETLAMFSKLGFEPEALLRDHVRDGSGELHDLIVMSHFARDTWSTMQATGIADVVAE
jgi:L-amino acid N-acyltransferase YncA